MGTQATLDERDARYNKIRQAMAAQGLDALLVAGKGHWWTGRGYVRYLTDRRLEELGFEPEFNVANPAKWMAAANDTFELVNFFEATNTSYEVNAQA